MSSKISALAKRILFRCNACGETFVMLPPLRSHKLCPECNKKMEIERVVE